MKNQYFGDINDFKKYGLLRCIIDTTGLKLLVAWMLTPNDGGPDGRFTSYLDKPSEYRHHDPQLFDGLKHLLSATPDRSVGLIESTDLVPGAVYWSELTPDAGLERSGWFDMLIASAGDTDMVFLDPDNGMEVKSRPYGRKYSSKFLYWREVDKLWSTGRSLLIYQHFIREKRPVFVQRMLEALHSATPGSFVEAFSTANVVFLMALQPRHQQFHIPICEVVQSRWGRRMKHWDLIRET